MTGINGLFLKLLQCVINIFYFNARTLVMEDNEMAWFFRPCHFIIQSTIGKVNSSLEIGLLFHRFLESSVSLFRLFIRDPFPFQCRLFSIFGAGC